MLLKAAEGDAKALELVVEREDGKVLQSGEGGNGQPVQVTIQLVGDWRAQTQVLDVTSMPALPGVPE